MLNLAGMKGDDISDRLIVLAVRIIEIVDALPETTTGKHIAGQLLRSGTSSGANYEEARGAESKRDFVHKLGLSLKELQETHYWLRVAEGSKLVPRAVGELVAEVGALCRIIGKSRLTAQSRLDRRSV